MINIEMAEDYIKRAKRYAKEAERALSDGDFLTTRKNYKVMDADNAKSKLLENV